MLRRENRNAMAEILQYQKAAGAAVIQTRRHAHSNPIQVVAARQAGPALLRSEAHASLHQKRKDTVMFMRFCPPALAVVSSSPVLVETLGEVDRGVRRLEIEPEGGR